MISFSPLCVRFVDRDMFMRYTQFGVGHPVTLRRIVRDIVAPADSMDVVDEDVANDEDHEQWNDEQEDGDDESSDEELEDEEDSENDRGEDEDEDVLDDDLSF